MKSEQSILNNVYVRLGIGLLIGILMPLPMVYLPWVRFQFGDAVAKVAEFSWGMLNYPAFSLANSCGALILGAPPGTEIAWMLPPLVCIPLQWMLISLAGFAIWDRFKKKSSRNVSGIL